MSNPLDLSTRFENLKITIEDTNKTNSTCNRSKNDSGNQPKVDDRFKSRKFISTFKNNDYSSLGNYKKTSSIRIEVPKNINTKDDIDPHDRWSQYAKTKDPSLILSKRKKSILNESASLKNPQEVCGLLVDELAKDDEDSFKEEDINPSDTIVPGLTVPLLPHQVIGLRFLKKRENEAGKYKGGLLFDDMGLGKTIQILSLILENRRSKEDEGTVKTTLIVCPVSLTNQWMVEIQKKAPELKCLIFHGIDRIRDHKNLIEYDVAITTYATISSEFNKYGEKSPLFLDTWWRIVLDEAHQIKNKRAKQSEAVFNLKSFRRWCLTGTPIQNNLSELQSLFKFIMVSKLSDEKIWKEIIVDAIQRKELLQALSDLKKELNPLMLRRTKNVLKLSEKFNLPQKEMHQIQVEFSKFERNIYDNVKEIILTKLTNEELNSESEDLKTNFAKLKIKKSILKDGREKTYICALVYLLRLRQLCCNWNLLFEYYRMDEVSDDFISNSSILSKKDPDLDDSLDNLTKSLRGLSVDSKYCDICMVELPKEQEGFYCSNCKSKLCPEKVNPSYISAKFKEVLNILSKDKTRKTIIFSQFTSLLDMLSPILEYSGYSSLKYTGSMSLKLRDDVLRKVKEDPSINILLCSLKCGSVGLNLTFSNRIIILDPYWNPAIQEQAIDRVYRIGQTKEVDIYEITVKDTVEDNILKLQRRKRQLASTITSNDSLENASRHLNKNRLSQQELLQLLGIDRG